MRSALPMLVWIVATGCQTPQRVYQPPRDPANLDDVSFLHYLATVPVVNVDEGTRAVLLLTNESTTGLTYQERSAQLMRVGAIRSGWHLEPGQILDKGTLGHMIRKICRLPPSWNERLATPTGWGARRYALKTCIYEGVMPYGTAREPVTGGELLSALTAAEERLPSDEKGGP